MGRKRPLNDSGKQNPVPRLKVNVPQKIYNRSDSTASLNFTDVSIRDSNKNISPLHIPMIPTFVADLTPTPTKFLRSCEEVGLFNEISKSSYTEDFKRDHSSEEPLSTQSENSVLSPLAIQSQAPIPAILESIADENEVEDGAQTMQDSSHGDFSISDANEESSSHMIFNVPQEEADIPAEVAYLEQPAERPHIQVLLQLPNGGFIPLNIPADALAQATIPVAPSPAVTVAPPAQQPTTPLVITPYGITSSTKQKLKAAVEQNIQQNQLNVMPTSSSHTMPRDVSTANSSGPSITKTPKLMLNVTNQYSPTIPEDVINTPMQSYSGKSSDDDDNEEKRKKFLESNRAAANRCRQKKKQWINGLEEKTKKLQEVNRSLTSETAQLRKEIAQLKQLLSAHKDCLSGSILTSTV